MKTIRRHTLAALLCSLSVLMFWQTSAAAESADTIDDLSVSETVGTADDADMTEAAAVNDTESSSSGNESGALDNLRAVEINLMEVNSKDELITFPVSGYFEGSDTSVFYMSLRDYYALLERIGNTTELEFTVQDDSLSVSRSNGSAVTFTKEGNTFYYTDMDMFIKPDYAVNGGDLVTTYPCQTDADGYILRDEDDYVLVHLIDRYDRSISFARSGMPVWGSLENYEIPVYWTEDDLILPLAVMNNLFRTGFVTQLVYLDGMIYAITGDAPDSDIEDENGLTLADYYYSSAVGDRTEELTNLTYNLLCLELDLNYGLQKEHSIENGFDSYLETIGLKDRMLSTDGQDFYDALSELVQCYFADFHSSLSQPGPYAGADYSYSPTSLPASTEDTKASDKRFLAARQAAGLSVYDEELDDDVVIEPYMEVGDTAYITFDHFVMSDYDYYSTEYQENITDYIGKETVSLVIYANQQINREDSPIRRVVVDLSCNGGGTLDAAVFLVSWMIGTCKFSTTNPITDAEYTVDYLADVNLDGYLTDQDCLDTDRLELYCLTSGSSFSCGNLVPAVLKQSGKVTILGQTTGGGACVVRQSITADGTIFSHSSNSHICTVKNGSYYSVDQGVTPDFTISKLEHFFDREWLTDYIENLP